MITKNTVLKILSCYRMGGFYKTSLNSSLDEECNGSDILFSLNDRKEIRYFAKWLKKFMELTVDVNALLKSSGNEVTLDSLTDYISLNNPDANDAKVLTKICNRYENLMTQRDDVGDLKSEIYQLIDDIILEEKSDNDSDDDDSDNPINDALIGKLASKGDMVAKEELNPFEYEEPYNTYFLDRYIIINRVKLTDRSHYLH